MISFEEIGNTLRCCFSGDLSSDFCALVEKELSGRVSEFLKGREEYEVVFDLAGCRYMASAFLRFCLFHCKLAGTKNFRIENPSADLRKVFQIAGFTEMMTIL